MKRYPLGRFSAILCLPIVWYLIGCSSQPVQKEGQPPKPELVIQIASINLGSLTKRLEKKDIKKIADLLKREQIEILAVQSVTRYPGVTTRVDFVDELARQGELNSAFGEMVNNSGRQTGNVVFSSYPIRSKTNQPFDNVKSVKFEAATHAVIDGGTRALYVVCAQLPPKSEDQAACISAVSTMSKWEKNDAVILTGNLADLEPANNPDKFLGVETTGMKNPGTRIWYKGNESLKLISSKTLETDLGQMLVAQFGILRQMTP